MNMSSGYYDRKPFPHENDAEWERVLRNISTQEAMPRPLIYGPDRMDSEELTEFYGDTWHWDSVGVFGWITMSIRYLAFLGLSTVSFAGLAWAAQPIIAPTVYVAREAKDILRYTFLMGTVVPERYMRNDKTYIRNRMMPFFFFSFKDVLGWFWKYYTKRSPVFVAGTYVGSRMVWAIEDVVGEDRMVNWRMPMMASSGFAALWLVYWRGKVVDLVRRPIAAGVVAFSIVWLMDSVYLSRRGFDAVWNPFNLRLPRSIVSILSGDPFNGEFVLGPIKYASSSLINATFRAVHSVSTAIPQSISSHLSLARSDPSDPGSSSSYMAHIDKNILHMEEQALIEQGFIAPEESSFSRSERDKFFFDRSQTLESFESSLLNPLRYLSSGQERLSQSTLEMVRFLFQDRLPMVVTPTFIPKPTNEVIFGNLNPGIDQSMDPEIIEKTRIQLEENSLSSHPLPLGFASSPQFGKHEIISSKYPFDPLFFDPIGIILSPITHVINEISNYYLSQSKHAFDDRPSSFIVHDRTSHFPTSPKSSNGSSTTTDSTPSANSSNSHSFSPSHLNTSSHHSSPSYEDSSQPIPYDLPPIIPQDVAERQSKAALDRHASALHIEQQVDEFKAVWTETVPELMGKAGALVSSGASLISSETSNFISPSSSSSSSPSSAPLPFSLREQFYMTLDRDELADMAASRWLPNDEYFKIIQASVEDSAQSLLPPGITAAQRLENFVQNVGGSDFEEPTEKVANLKLPRHRSRRFRRSETSPIFGDRVRQSLSSAIANLKREAKVRSEFAISFLSSSPTSDRNRLEMLEKQRIAQESLQRDIEKASERLRQSTEPIKQWFRNFVDRWNNR